MEVIHLIGKVVANGVIVTQRGGRDALRFRVACCSGTLTTYYEISSPLTSYRSYVLTGRLVSVVGELRVLPPMERGMMQTLYVNCMKLNFLDSLTDRSGSPATVAAAEDLMKDFGI